MQTEIFYFTGTGNSLAIAKRLNQSLEESKLIPIAKVLENDKVISEAEVVGIVNPIYYICAPDIVLKFLNKLEMPNVKYIFFALTRGFFIAYGAATQMKKILKPKGYRVNSAWYFTMDQTYLPVYNIKSIEKREILFNKAYKKVDRVADLIRRRQSRWEFNHSDIFYRINEKVFFKDIGNEDKKFYLNDNCNSCRTCEKVCPVNNIKIDNGKPKWMHMCESCQACVHFCPQHAIEVMGMRNKKGITEGKKRITHPEISIKDMMYQKTKGVF